MDASLARLKPYFSALLEPWYLAQARDLPWRNTSDPYAIWVSEIMLQQTQVVTVLPYFSRFMETFPTVEALAQAPAEFVLKQWEGLGYYSRCRHLHEAAQVVVRDFQGKVPHELKSILSLPGVGRYTAGAILSFAYHQRVPLLDGNVKRILARLLGDEAPINQPATEKKQWTWIQSLLEASQDPYTFNQAIMELGAVICTPKQPKCLLCPLPEHCRAFQEGRVETLPVKIAPKAVPYKHIGVAILQNEAGAYFIQQRPKTGLLANLWEFPGGKQEARESIEATIQRELKEELNIEVSVGLHALDIDHAYTHLKVTLHVFHVHLNMPPRQLELNAAQAFRWASLAEMEALPFPKANHAILQYLHQREKTSSLQ
ncbi:MAG: A/G-specific adenine glycosylase [Vampirovibrio sp.]